MDDTQAPQDATVSPEDPQAAVPLNRKARRALVAVWRQGQGLRRRFGTSNWHPRPKRRHCGQHE